MTTDIGYDYFHDPFFDLHHDDEYPYDQTIIKAKHINDFFPDEDDG